MYRQCMYREFVSYSKLLNDTIKGGGNIKMSDKFSIELFQKVLRSYSLKWGRAVVFLIVCAFIFGSQNALSSRIIAIGDIISVVLFSIGINTIGLFAIGVNVGGLFAIGVNAIGVFAIGANASGVFAAGYRACGIYVLSYEKKSMGIYVFSPVRQDTGAVSLFTRVFPQLRKPFS